MPTLFPELLYLSPLAPFIVRVVVTIVFLNAGIEHIRFRHALVHRLTPALSSRPLFALWTIAVVEIAIALSLVLGYLAQAGAIVGAVFAFTALLYKPHLRALAPYDRATYILLLGACLSIVISGAGAFAYDLPL